MQRNLFLCRHADTFDPKPNQNDFDRSLTPMGEKQATVTGKWLSDQEITIQEVLCSTSLRTKTTANLIINQLGYLPDKVVFDEHLYRAKASGLLDVLAKIDKKIKNVLLIGHNPAISHLSQMLSEKDTGYFSPANMALIQLNLNDWEEIQYTTGKLAAFHQS